MPLFRRVRLPLVVAVAALLAPRPFAQAPARQQPPATFRAEANYVRVDAFVTDDGVPITDLTASDFEVLEDGVVQTIDAFEYVRVRANVPEAARREPRTVAESRAAIEDPRSRVFVLFLDTRHVSQGASRHVAQPLVTALDNMIADGDLVAVMTADMSPAAMTFARKTTSIRGMLERNWWGERDAQLASDPVEEMYRWCYMPVGPAIQDPFPRMAQMMIDRRREKITMDALENLVEFLRGAREERKAVLAITEGWRLFRPDPLMMAPKVEPDREHGRPGIDGLVPRLPGVGADPRTGRPAVGSPTDLGAAAEQRCESDRMQLANIDNDDAFRRMTGNANRSNTSFYPIDPRGLAAFDMPIGPNRPVPPGLDREFLSARLESLRRLATDTDGTAIVGTNDLAGALQRVVTDLSSYYLLGYYSSGKLDGRYHSITVRVKRPGVQVRARRGYHALTLSDVTRTSTASSASGAAAAPNAAAIAAAAVSSAVDSLAAFSRDRRFYFGVAAGWTSGSRPVFVSVGELSPSEAWRSGADVDLQIIDSRDQVVATARAEISPGQRSFRAVLVSARPLEPGRFTVNARTRLRAPDTTPIVESAALDLTANLASAGGVYLRRGQTTGNRDVPTADLRFRRGDRLRVEVPWLAARAATARLLDRTGKALPIPLSFTTRDDPDGIAWHTAELALTPLAAGDYVIELAGGAGRVLLPFRVVP